jgi:hypothetical protein
MRAGERGALDGFMPSLNGLDAQGFDAIEVAAVIGEQREAVSERGRGNHQVEVTDYLSCRAETTAFSTEDFRRRLVDKQKIRAHQEVPQSVLGHSAVATVIDTFVQLSQRYHREGQSLLLYLVKAAPNLLVPVQPVNHPVSVNQLARAHRCGRFLVEIKRSR